MRDTTTVSLMLGLTCLLPLLLCNLSCIPFLVLNIYNLYMSKKSDLSLLVKELNNIHDQIRMVE